MPTMNRVELKKDWKEVNHPSGKYWYHKVTRETTRDMPLAHPPNVATACIVLEEDDAASVFESCRHCHSSVIPDVRFWTLTAGQSWLKKRCCPVCDGIIDYAEVCKKTSSTKAPTRTGNGNTATSGAPIGRQESFARRLARTWTASWLPKDESKQVREEDSVPKVQRLKPAPSAVQAEATTSSTKAAAEEHCKSTNEEGSTSSTRRRLSLKRSRVVNGAAEVATEMKSPRVSQSDQIRMVVDTTMNGVTSGQTAKFVMESEVV